MFFKLAPMNYLCLAVLGSTLASVTISIAANPPPNLVPAEMFATDDPKLEVTVWAASPVIKNPTNIDTDQFGRIWVAEGVNYRRHYDRQPEGDRIVVLQDTDGDGRADKSWTFVQEPFLRSPMGVAVVDNRLIVSMAPDIVVYTDVNRDAKFDPAVDKREVVLTGFNGRVHDHTIHSVTVGPDGQWYWNAGNCGAVITDKSGKTFRIGSSYNPYYGAKPAGDLGWDPRQIAGQKSDDGHVYVGGFAARMNPDGSGVNIIGHNFRNSYEQTVTSFGDVFQNDNDDPPACRTAFLMERGNAGFSSFDGQRSWQADRRPGQSVPTAQWRQEDPGTMPAGDVYGGGSPTGIAFVEDSALGKESRGLLLSCEPGRNVVFGYFPKPDGAGHELKRFNFLTSNKAGKFAGGDYSGGDKSVSGELPTLFRPSDVMVGADGAIYVADFFDPRVGGVADREGAVWGESVRLAGRGFNPKVPRTDFTTIAGAVAALKSPAVNVRGAAFHALMAQTSQNSYPGAFIKPVAKLLEDENPAVRARAVWLVAQFGPDGLARVQSLLKDKDAQMRVVAFRALRREMENRRAGEAMVALCERMAKDSSAAVRREVALALRDVPFPQASPALLTVAKAYDGKDRWMLEAIGTGATGKESALYDALVPALGGANPAQWTPAWASLAWRLHPPQSVGSFRARAMATNLSTTDRKAALTALAYIGSGDAVNGILDAAATADGLVKAEATWWLLNRKDNAWKDYALDAQLKSRRIYDPDDVEIVSSSMPEPALPKAPTLAEVNALKGDAKRGREQTARCVMCHRIGNEGTDVGPDLSNFGRAQTREVVVQSILNPSADIAHGYGAHEIKTKDGLRIEGLVLTDGNPVVMLSAGGLTQMIPAKRIESKNPLNRSLMWTPEALGLTAQDVADLVAYLKSL